MSEVTGVVHRLQGAISPGYGFTGIIIAWLAKLNPFAVVLVSILFGGLIQAGREIQPSGVPRMLQGIILFCVIGSYSIGNNTGDVLLMLIFGIVGYLMRKFSYDAPPLVLALVLGGELESSLRQSLMLSRGSFSTFISRPLSLAFLIVAVLLLIVPLVTQRRKLSGLKE